MDIVILTIVGILAFGWIWSWIMTLIFGPSESSSDSDDALLYLIFFTDIFDSHHDDD